MRLKPVDSAVDAGTLCRATRTRQDAFNFLARDIGAKVRGLAGLPCPAGQQGTRPGIVIRAANGGLRGALCLKGLHGQGGSGLGMSEHSRPCNQRHKDGGNCFLVHGFFLCQSGFEISTKHCQIRAAKPIDPVRLTRLQCAKLPLAAGEAELGGKVSDLRRLVAAG